MKLNCIRFFSTKENSVCSKRHSLKSFLYHGINFYQVGDISKYLCFLSFGGSMAFERLGVTNIHWSHLFQKFATLNSVISLCYSAAWIIIIPGEMIFLILFSSRPFFVLWKMPLGFVFLSRKLAKAESQKYVWVSLKVTLSQLHITLVYLLISSISYAYSFLSTIMVQVVDHERSPCRKVDMGGNSGATGFLFQLSAKCWTVLDSSPCACKHPILVKRDFSSTPLHAPRSSRSRPPSKIGNRSLNWLHNSYGFTERWICTKQMRRL